MIINLFKFSANRTERGDMKEFDEIIRSCEKIERDCERGIFICNIVIVLSVLWSIAGIAMIVIIMNYFIQL